MTRTRLILVAAVLVGLTAGIGGYTFVYAKGYSYLTNDTAACANCHIMRDHYSAWTHGSHLEEDPPLKTIWAGCAFSKDFREERGHAFMLEDQTFTERQQVTQQPGTCMHCHASGRTPSRARRVSRAPIATCRISASAR